MSWRVSRPGRAKLCGVCLTHGHGKYLVVPNSKGLRQRWVCNSCIEKGTSEIVIFNQVINTLMGQK